MKAFKRGDIVNLGGEKMIWGGPIATSDLMPGDENFIQRWGHEQSGLASTGIITKTNKKTIVCDVRLHGQSVRSILKRSELVGGLMLDDDVVNPITKV